MKMYYKGKGVPVDVHPAKVEEMKEKGWQLKTKRKEINNG